MQHHHEHFWWRFFPKKEMSQMYISVALRYFAISLISLFVPLYLFKEIGYSLPQTLYFFIFYAVVFAIFSPLAAKFCARYGVKHAILISVPFYLGFIILLYFLPSLNTPLVVISALLGVAMAFYWMGMHEFFYQISDYNHRGEEFGKREAISILATLFGPLAGGFLIQWVGFQFVFMLAAVLLFLAAFFLFASEEKHIPYHFSIRGLLDKRYWQNSLFFTSRGMRAIAAGVLWPLFIFVILKEDYFLLGVVGSVMAGVSAILIWVTGRFSDGYSKREIIRWVVGFEALSWVWRALVSTVGQVFGATLFGGVTFGIYESPVGALEYDKARGDIAAYFVSRETFICLGRIMLLMFVLMMDSLSGGLIFNGIASLAALLF